MSAELASLLSPRSNLKSKQSNWLAYQMTVDLQADVSLVTCQRLVETVSRSRNLIHLSDDVIENIAATDVNRVIYS